MRLLDQADMFDAAGDALVTVFGAIFVFVGIALIRFGSAVLGLWTGLTMPSDWAAPRGLRFTRDPAEFLSRSFT